MFVLSRWMTIGLLGAAACGNVTNETPDAATPDAPPGPATITLTNQMYGASPVNTGLVAYQDGDGPWQVVTGNAGVYTLSVSQPRYSLAVACGHDTGQVYAYVQIFHYAVADAPSLYTLEECMDAVTTANVNISGTVAGLATGDSATISDGISSYGGTQLTTFNMQAQPGPGTLLGIHRSNNRAVGIVVQKPTFAEGQTFAIDFATQLFPAEAAITFDPTATTPSMSTVYYDENGAGYTIDSAAAVVPTYRVMPADKIGAGISGVSLIASSGGVSRSARHFFKTPTAQTLTLPAAFQPAAPQVVATAPYPMPTMTLPTQPGARYYYVNYSTSTGTSFQSWYVVYSAAWLGTAATVESTLPDLSTLPGWGNWGLQTMNRSWGAGVYSGPVATLPSVGARDARGRQPNLYQDGDVVTASTTYGTF